MRSPRQYPAKQPFWVKARFEFSWETGMRPEMVDALRVPENDRKGTPAISLHAGDDKNRMGRVLPISDRARAALDRICPPKGVIFGKHDYREVLPRAAEKAPAEHDVAHDHQAPFVAQRLERQVDGAAGAVRVGHGGAKSRLAL